MSPDKTTKELGSILSRMYHSAGKREKAAMVHLFGILYAGEIRRAGVWRVVEKSKIKKSYKVEVNKGINLAHFVTVKKKFLQ